jgi:riboflavin synthase alpha subunit
LSHLRAGDEVNLEADVIAKYVERIMQFNGKAQAESLTVERLAELGFE